jgi:hypothetical protein
MRKAIPTIWLATCAGVGLFIGIHLDHEFLGLSISLAIGVSILTVADETFYDA